MQVGDYEGIRLCFMEPYGEAQTLNNNTPGLVTALISLLAEASLFSDSGTDDAKNILLAVELVPRLLPLIV